MAVHSICKTHGSWHSNGSFPLWVKPWCLGKSLRLFLVSISEAGLGPWPRMPLFGPGVGHSRIRAELGTFGMECNTTVKPKKRNLQTDKKRWFRLPRNMKDLVLYLWLNQSFIFCTCATVAKHCLDVSSIDVFCLLMSPISQLLLETEGRGFLPVLKPKEHCRTGHDL